MAPTLAFALASHGAGKERRKKSRTRGDGQDGIDWRGSEPNRQQQSYGLQLVLQYVPLNCIKSAQGLHAVA